MAISVGNNQTFRLRELRSDAVGRDKSEVRAPTRRKRFDDRLNHPRAGEVVGRFPAEFDKAPPRQRAQRNLIGVATARQQPRSAVAALMAREGISTFTKFGLRLPKKQAADRDAEAAEKTSPWARLAEANAGASAGAGASGALPPGSNADQALGTQEGDRMAAEKLRIIEGKKAELKAADKFLASIDGYSMLENSMKGNDERILKEAGKLEASLQPIERRRDLEAGPKSNAQDMMGMMKDEAVLGHQLNLRYLAIQDKLLHGADDLVSNLMRIRNQTVQDAIDGAGG